MGIKIKVLYEDKSLIVFDKPSGLLVIPAPGRDINTLTNIANEQHATREGGRLHPCHRLDKETSGVIIYAKGKKNQKLMLDAFHQMAVKKKYIAFVQGRLKKKSGHIKALILDRYKAKYGRRSKMAVTEYKVKKEFPGFSVLEVMPQTGRTHQIRIHCKQIGHPILGERIYAYRKDFDIDFKRLALHAHEVAFTHPVLKKNMIIQAQMPKDMKDFLKKFN